MNTWKLLIEAGVLVSIPAFELVQLLLECEIIVWVLAEYLNLFFCLQVLLQDNNIL